MKKIFLTFIFLLILPVCAETAADADKLQEEREPFVENKWEKNFFGEKPYKIKKTSAVRPKREHFKTKIYAQTYLDKNKANFQKRKEKELNLLQKEYLLLEYRD